MSLKKIIRKNIEDNAVTEPKIANEAVTAEKLGTDFITGLDELTSVAEDDDLLISDTSAGTLKKVSKANTTTLATPTFSSVSPDNSQTADGGNITFTITGTGFTAGTNARLIGASGQRLNFTSVTRSTSTSITATIARSSLLQAQSPYGIQVINGEGLAVTTASLITVDNIPVFNTAAGSLGTFTEGDSIDIEVSAYDPDSTSGITYELQSGSLPAGLSLVNESGDSCRIQGTASAVSADTTSNFTLRATDSASNTTSRSFSITIEDFSMNGLRFDDGSNDSLSKTNGTPTSTEIFTFSCWVKRSVIGRQRIFTVSDDPFDNDFSFLELTAGHGLSLTHRANDGTSIVSRISNNLLRDSSAWYHIVVNSNVSSGTSDDDKARIYINGVEASYASETNSSGVTSLTMLESGKKFVIGENATSNSYTIDAYMSEVIFVDGQQLDSTSFGEADSNGVWIPKPYSGTFGNMGFHLDFADSANLGNDVSGNDNDFTENNLTSIDAVTDTPQNNFCTLNPLDIGGGSYTFSNGNTTINTDGGLHSTFSVGQGKWYAEFKLTGSVNYGIGIRQQSYDITQAYGTGGKSAALFLDEVNFYKNGLSTASYVSSWSTGDILQVGADLDNNNIYFGKNGSWWSGSAFDSSTPSTAQSIDDIDDYTFSIILVSAGAGNVDANFGNPPYTISSGNSDGNGYGNFEYAVPSGYYALNTKNLAQYG